MTPYVIKVGDLHLCVLEMRVLDSMTDRHLADPLLSSEGGQGVGCGSHLLAFAQFRNTLAHFYSTIDLHPPIPVLLRQGFSCTYSKNLFLLGIYFVVGGEICWARGITLTGSGHSRAPLDLVV